MEGKRVLVIDDEAEIRRNLTIGLMQEGFVCTTCPDGISAIHELSRSRKSGVAYDCLVTDIFMPDIDGLKILKVIKRENPGLPVVVITGFGDEDLKKLALEQENTAYLDKPFDVQDLVAAIKGLNLDATTLDAEETAESSSSEGGEAITAYITVRISEPEKGEEIYKELYFMDGISSCEAARGHVDIILQARAQSENDLTNIRSRIDEISGVEVLSVSAIERPKLDRDVESFMKEYKLVIKEGADGPEYAEHTVKSYLFIDIDPDQMQEIFTTVYFIDEIVVCDVIEEGSKLVAMVYESVKAHSAEGAIEKLKQTEGVLRVRKADIIKMMDA